MATPGWAYVGCEDFATGSGPTGSIQYLDHHNQITGSDNLYFQTGSVGPPGKPDYVPYTLVLTGTLMVSGGISASWYHIEHISEIDVTGSTKFGNTNDDIHQRTGSLGVSLQSQPKALLWVTSSGGAVYEARVGIGLSGSLLPSGSLHVQVGQGCAAGPSAYYNDVVIASDDRIGLTLLCPDDKIAGIALGSATDNVNSYWVSNYNNAYAAFGTTTAGHVLKLYSGNGAQALLLDAKQSVSASADITASANIIVGDSIAIRTDGFVDGVHALALSGAVIASSNISGSAFYGSYLSSSANLGLTASAGGVVGAGQVGVAGSLSASLTVSGSSFHAPLLRSTGTGLNIEAHEGDLNIKHLAGAAGLDINITNVVGDDAGSVHIASTETVADAISLNAWGTDSGVAIDATGPLSIDSSYNNAAALNISTAGGTAAKLLISSTLGTDPEAIKLQADAGGITLEASEVVVNGVISGSAQLHAVGDSFLEGTLNVSGAYSGSSLAVGNVTGRGALGAGDISGSSTLQVVGATILGSTLNVTGAVTVADNILPFDDNTQDLGAAGKRWANVYTGDLHLANERGDWTVIEEDEYLTIRNNKNGKRFRLLMEEVED